MKLVIAGVLAASTLALALPASAQGIYIGPRGGVGVGVGGVGVGADPYYGDRYDRYDDDTIYEGRSAYRNGYRYDDGDDLEDF